MWTAAELGEKADQRRACDHANDTTDNRIVQLVGKREGYGDRHYGDRAETVIAFQEVPVHSQASIRKVLKSRATSSKARTIP